uniref:Uncharacterized protein n=1 Tax=Lactuca sativa TaxID=4236 RepID=A0A9R1W5R6_LACSA|nr:hypothetical protein LSAT_V11C300133410 [Lactuca sativa]
MFLKELELKLENESVRNLNPIRYPVWLARNRIRNNFRICLAMAAVAVTEMDVVMVVVAEAVEVAAAMVMVVSGGNDGGGGGC